MRCGVMSNKTTIHQGEDQVDVGNYKQPHGFQQWDEPIPYIWCKPKHGNYDTIDYEYKPQYV